MQDEFHTYAIDLALASQSSIGQQPVKIEGAAAGGGGALGYISLSRYGRFGNNIYQLLNAYWMAKTLRVPKLVLDSFDFIDECVVDDIQIQSSEKLEGASRPGLSGSLYAPYGFEPLFNRTMQSNAAFLQMLNVLRTAYKSLIARSVRKKTIAIHFRSGDVFDAAPHPWYVQPPASYYINCFEHAVKNAIYESIELIYEDRLNPAIEIVENVLTARGIQFSSRSSTLGGDLSRLLSADCIISSYGSFCEGAGFLSKYLKNYYCFRDPSSQSDLRPFSQCWTAQLLLAGSVNLYICDDLNFDYIRARCWQNSPEQQDAIRSFSQNSLRLYKY